ncbi:FadR/GntR family transcriptional regulator [Dyadobacter tibetensis]|uniref:FadR/GntR family transcriptional regulator n=1 Tax=Dyadobacter tibetensis TaxID=1211851 RepID=UPI0004BB0D24|nr:GntR family transcriptional regulator [Dyadobacter tibetensis]
MTIKRQRLADEVAEQLTSQIKEGQFLIGDKLPTEPALMEIFGVGRSTIREAIRNLSHAGLVRVQQGLGTFVEQSAASETLSDRLLRAKGKDLNDVRQLIELKIAEKAASNRTLADIEEMRRHLQQRDEMAQAHQAIRCIEADIQFHMSIARAAKSEIMLDLYKTIAGHLQDYFLELFADTEKFIETQRLHEDLLDSIIAQDPYLAWHAAAQITGQPVANI